MAIKASLDFEEVTSNEDERFATILSVYPNPASEFVLANYAINQKSNVRIALIDLAGKEVSVLKEEEVMGAGNYTLTASLDHVNPGTYLLHFAIGEGKYTRKVVIE